MNKLIIPTLDFPNMRRLKCVAIVGEDHTHVIKSLCMLPNLTVMVGDEPLCKKWEQHAFPGRVHVSDAGMLGRIVRYQDDLTMRLRREYSLEHGTMKGFRMPDSVCITLVLHGCDKSTLWSDVMRDIMINHRFYGISVVLLVDKYGEIGAGCRKQIEYIGTMSSSSDTDAIWENYLQKTMTMKKWRMIEQCCTERPGDVCWIDLTKMPDAPDVIAWKRYGADEPEIVRLH